MGKKNGTPDLPATPTYQADPTAQAVPKDLYSLGTKLTNFDLSGGLSSLQDTINYQPQQTQLALQSAQGFLTPAYNDLVQQTRNEAAANNQLESSTYTDALAKNAFNLQSQYQGITANAALQSAQQAIQNRLSLFGTGLNTLESAGGMAQGNQSALNNFNLENYQNQVAATLASQKQKSGGLFGALTGGVGGALAGAALAAPTGGLSMLAGGLLGGAGGGLLGGFGPSGTGGGLLGAGAVAYGSQQNPLMNRRISGSTGIYPGSAAGALGNNNQDLYSRVQGLNGFGF